MVYLCIKMGTGQWGVNGKYVPRQGILNKISSEELHWTKADEIKQNDKRWVVFFIGIWCDTGLILKRL